MNLSLRSSEITPTSFNTLQDFQKLIEGGLDVNFQYQNNDTPLHSAIRNKNVECIELLLKHHPKLNIRNDKGESVEELAKKVSHDGIIELLREYRNNVYDSIDPKFIIERDENISYEDIAELKDDEDFKILRVKACCNIKSLFDKFKQKYFKKEFSETSHLFAFIIEVDENFEDDFKFPVSMFNDNRPFIVIITQEAQLPKVYYKISNAKRLVRLHFKATLSHRSSEVNCCPFSRLIRDSVINVLEKRMTVNKGEIFRTFSLLSIRLKKLFRSNLELPVPSQIDPSPSDLKERLMAFYGLSFLNPEEKWHEILMAVIKSNDIEVLKLLLRNGFESDCQEEHMNTAWNLKHYECVTELLEADLCFPENFKLDLVGQTIDRLRAIITTRNSFHDAIKAGNTDMINDLLNKNPRWKFVYNQENQSAVTIALESKRFDIYSEFRSRGFLTGVDKSFEVVINVLSDEEKREISEINKKYFTNLKHSHLLYLLSQVQLSFNQGNSSTLFSVVRSMFDKLDQIPEFQPVLKLLENCKKIKIVIDFDKPYVLDMDPMATDASSGMTYPNSGYIYIAAKNYKERFNDILGVLAHELMHYAMDLVYDNNCKPYELHDSKREKQFRKILLRIKKHWIKNRETTIDIICRVFDSYPMEQWHAELIVRVPHLYAFYKEKDDEAITFFQQQFCKDLFDFYKNFTLLDINTKCGLLKTQMEVQEINKASGLLHEIDKCDYKVQTGFSFDLFLEPTVINSNVPMLSLACSCQILFKQFSKKITKCVIFAEIESLENSHMLERMKHVCESTINLILVIKADKRNYSYETLKAIKGLTYKVVIICRNNISEEDTERLNFKYSKITHVWEDLSGKSREKLMQKKVIFQGHEINLHEILPKDSKDLNQFPLKDLLSLNKVTIDNHETKQNNPTFLQNVYVHRKFAVRKSQGSESRALNTSEAKIVKNEMSEEEIIQEAETRKVLIVSNIAGMGKSTTMFEVAKNLINKHRTHWVNLVHLKQHIGTFEKIRKSPKPVTKLHEILKKCIKKSVDQMIFLKLYEAGKAIILLDGVDEISPDFSDLIMEALKLFDINSGNQLWITTRVHLQEDLEKQFNQLACKLLPMTIDDQIEIVANHWKSKNKKVQDISYLKMLASKLIVKISEGLKNSKSDLMEIPLQIRIIAEIYEEITNRNIQEVEEINFYSIYNAFYEKTFDNCLENKGPLLQVSLNKINKSSVITVLTAHHTIALCHLFGSDFNDFQDDVEDLTEETKELIDKVGIAYFDSETEKYCFIHESFAEYFVANYVLANLRRRVKKQISQLLYLILANIKYRMIRNFLDEALKIKDLPANLCFDSLEKYLEEEKLYKLLIESVYEGLENLVKFILNIMNSFKNKKLKKKIVKCKTIRNFTILMSACNRINFEGKITKIVCKYLQKLLTENELRLLMLKKDEYGANALHFVFEYCNQNGVQLLLKMVTKLFSAKERKEFICSSNLNGMNIWHYAAMNQNNKIFFTTIRNSLKEVLKDIEIITMLRQNEKYGCNVFHNLIYDSNKTAFDDFKAFVQIVFKDKRNLKLYLTEKTSEYGSNVLHLAAQKSKNKFFHDILKFMQLFFDSVELKDLLLETDNDGENIWHLAARNYGNKGIFTIMHESLVEALTDLEFITMLRQQDIDGFNVFHHLIYVSSKAALDDFKAFVQNVLKNKKDLKLLTEKCGKNDLNVLQLAAQKSKNDFFRDIWKFLQLFYDPVELKDLLLATNKNRSNILQIAAYNNDNKIIFTTIQDSLKEVLTDIEILTMLRQQSISGLNVFQILIYASNKTAFDDFKSFVQIVFKNKQELKLYLTELRGVHGSNVLQMAARNSENDFFNEIWTFLQLFNDRVKLKDLLLETDENGWNILHFAAYNRDKETLTYFCNHLRSVLNQEDIKSLLLQTSKRRNNIFHIAVKYNSSKNVKTLWYILKEYLNIKEQKIFLQSCNVDMHNVFHLAAQNIDHNFIFKELRNCSQNVLSTDEVNSLLQQQSINGYNVFQKLMLNKNEGGLKEFYEIMKT